MKHPHAGYGDHRIVNKDGRIIPVDTDMQCWPCVIGTCDRNHVKTVSDERLERAIKRANGRQARQRREMLK